MSHPSTRFGGSERPSPLPGGEQRPLVLSAAGPSLYLCAACDQQWPYQSVRHTARCPTCGGGLLRVGDAVDG